MLFRTPIPKFYFLMILFTVTWSRDSENIDCYPELNKKICFNTFPKPAAGGMSELFKKLKMKSTPTVKKKYFFIFPHFSILDVLFGSCSLKKQKDICKKKKYSFVRSLKFVKVKTLLRNRDQTKYFLELNLIVTVVPDRQQCIQSQNVLYHSTLLYALFLRGDETILPLKRPLWTIRENGLRC